MIDELQESYTVQALCRVFEVHRSSYRYWTAAQGKINPEQLMVDAEVKDAYSLSGGSAGARTVATLVTSGGFELSRYRAAKAMRRLGLVSCQPPKHNYKTAQKSHEEIKNHLNREFSPVRPNQVWCGDVTYLWVGGEWLYLATILDLYGRKIVGFALSDSPDSELTKQALSNAFELRGEPSALMFHSDQGCHYTSVAFRELIGVCEIKQSMSRRGNCWDNAPMERFFRSLKTENMPKAGYKSDAAARTSVQDYIFKYYNSVRPHSHNLGMSPNEKEKYFWETSNQLAKKG